MQNLYLTKNLDYRCMFGQRCRCHQQQQQQQQQGPTLPEPSSEGAARSGRLITPPRHRAPANPPASRPAPVTRLRSLARIAAAWKSRPSSKKRRAAAVRRARNPERFADGSEAQLMTQPEDAEEAAYHKHSAEYMEVDDENPGDPGSAENEVTGPETF